MIKKFSSETRGKLGYYVYVYSDPDTGKPFYIGQGKDNRVFSHLQDNQNLEKEKSIKIKQLEQQGKKPIIDILSHGLDKETALKVEAAAIDLVGLDNLTNLQRGHHSSVYGKIEVSTLDARYRNEELTRKDIIDNVLFIRINDLYRNDMSPLELYEATRGYWVVSVDVAVNKTKKVDYAFAVYDGMVLEVYEVVDWFPAGSTFMATRDMTDNLGRYEFVGRVATRDVRERYVDKSVKSFFKRGSANPIKYEWGRDLLES